MCLLLRTKPAVHIVLHSSDPHDHSTMRFISTRDISFSLRGFALSDRNLCSFPDFSFHSLALKE